MKILAENWKYSEKILDEIFWKSYENFWKFFGKLLKYEFFFDLDKRWYHFEEENGAFKEILTIFKKYSLFSSVCQVGMRTEFPDPIFFLFFRTYESLTKNLWVSVVRCRIVLQKCVNGLLNYRFKRIFMDFGLSNYRVEPFCNIKIELLTGYPSSMPVNLTKGKVVQVLEMIAVGSI